MENKKELVVSVIFDGHDGERYKVPTCEHDIEKITLLDCGDIDCLGYKLQCENCIFHKGKVFRKGELELIVEEKEEEKYNLEDLEDLEEIKDLQEEVKKLVLFDDKEGEPHLLPFLDRLTTTANYNTMKLKCRNINCVHDNNLRCKKCPLINHGELNPGEFKILKPKDKGSEE